MVPGHPSPAGQSDGGGPVLNTSEPLPRNTRLRVDRFFRPAVTRCRARRIVRKRSVAETTSDETLMAAYQAGNQAAFGAVCAARRERHGFRPPVARTDRSPTTSSGGVPRARAPRARHLRREPSVPRPGQLFGIVHIRRRRCAMRDARRARRRSTTATRTHAAPSAAPRSYAGADRPRSRPARARRRARADAAFCTRCRRTRATVPCSRASRACPTRTSPRRVLGRTLPVTKKLAYSGVSSASAQA